MLIRYQPNPLCTIVELDEHDLEKLRLKIVIEEMEERIYDAYIHLEPGEHFDPQVARQRLRVEGLEDEALTRRVDEMMTWYVQGLRGEHQGDCICEPCSCIKCHAEELLGINTIAGLGSHSARNFLSAFANGRTMDEAITYLLNYKPVNGLWKQGDFYRYVPRWIEQAKAAAEWLQNYRRERF